MANIIVEVQGGIYNGMPVAFKAPCDCASIEALEVRFSGGMMVFALVDAHKVPLPLEGKDAFTAGAVVKAILDTADGTAFIQNADTNSYLEKRFGDVEKAVGYLGGKVVSSWSEVQEIVQSGIAPIVFNVGEEFTCNHSDYGELTWRIIGFDSETLPNGQTKPSMTIQLKSSTTSLGTEFEPKEALYAFGDTLPAGTYCFTLTEGYKDVMYNGKKHAVADYPYANFQFTTTEDAFKDDFSESGQLCFDSFTASRSAVYMNLNAYSGNAMGTTERTPIISVKSKKATTDNYDGTDITELLNPNILKAFKNGTNRWLNSCVRWWLNSNLEYGSWYFGKGGTYSRPPEHDYAGFLFGLDEELRSIIKPVVKRTKKNNVEFDGSVDSTTETMFLLSASEVGLSTEDEGAVYEYYKNSSSEDGGMLRSCKAESNAELIREGTVLPACVIY